MRGTHVRRCTALKATCGIKTKYLSNQGSRNFNFFLSKSEIFKEKKFVFVFFCQQEVK